MLLPVLVFGGLAFVGPLFMVGHLSLFDTNYVVSKYVGLRNFVAMFSDRYFVRSLSNAFWYIIFVMPLLTFLSYKSALLLASMNKRAATAGRFMFYIPALTAGIIISLVWRWIYAREGLANWIISSLGLPVVSFFSDQWAARIAISIIIISMSMGSYSIVMFAGIKAIPKELHDAARIDGASDRQYRRFVITPLMVPTILLVALLTMISATQIWETVYWMTNGGPGGYTASPIFDIYLTGFQNGHYGLASAKSIFVMVLIALVSLGKNRVEKWAST